jgi:hypothetical protein
LPQYAGRFPDMVNKIQHSLALTSNQFAHAKENLLHYVMTFESARDVTLVLFLVLVCWYLITCIAQLSYLYTGLSIVALKNRIKLMNRNEWVVFISYFIVNILITASFFSIHFFLARRYLMAQNLLLMLLVPFGLNYLWEMKDRIKRYLVITLILAWMISSNYHLLLMSDDNHGYLRYAGNWLKHYTVANEPIYTNDQFILYSVSDKQTYYPTLSRYFSIANAPKNQLNQFHYAVVNNKEPGAEALLGELKRINAVEVRHFENKRGSQVLIYRLQIPKGNVK